MTEFRSGPLSCTATRSSSPSLSNKHFDIGLVQVSPDGRAGTAASIPGVSFDSIAILNDQAAGPSQSLLGTYQSWAQAAGATTYDFDYASEVSALELWPLLLDLARACYQEKGHALRAFVDLSAANRFLALAFIFSGLTEHLFAAVEVVYGEAAYAEGHGETRLSEGAWQAVGIPGLEGEYEPSNRRHMVVSLGFEGLKTLRLVNRHDPDLVSALVGDPGAQEGYSARAFNANQELLDEYAVTVKEIVRAPAGDPTIAWSQLKEASHVKPFEQNVQIVATGSKPHALAAGLFAYDMLKPSVWYAMPALAKTASIKSNGYFWHYTIENLAVYDPRSNE